MWYSMFLLLMWPHFYGYKSNKLLMWNANDRVGLSQGELLLVRASLFAKNKKPMYLQALKFIEEISTSC